MAILATRSGWLIMANLLSETDTSWTVFIVDKKQECTIKKTDKYQQVFNGVAEAQTWIESVYDKKPAGHKQCLSS